LPPQVNTGRRAVQHQVAAIVQIRAREPLRIVPVDLIDGQGRIADPHHLIPEAEGQARRRAEGQRAAEFADERVAAAVDDARGRREAGRDGRRVGATVVPEVARLALRFEREQTAAYAGAETGLSAEEAVVRVDFAI